MSVDGYNNEFPFKWKPTFFIIMEFPFKFFKTAAGRFDTINDNLRSLNLAQFLPKERRSPIWRYVSRGVSMNRLLTVVKFY